MRAAHASQKWSGLAQKGAEGTCSRGKEGIRGGPVESAYMQGNMRDRLLRRGGLIETAIHSSTPR